MRHLVQFNPLAHIRSDLHFFKDTSAVERRNFYGVLTVLVIIACLWLGLRGNITFPLDDAYITLHNAEVLRSGVDQNYHGTPALAGATSVLHLVLVAGFATLFSPELASFLVCSLAVLAYALGLARLAFQMRASCALAGLIVGIGTLSGYVPKHLFNGLETGMAMAAGAWALSLALSEKPSWRLPVLCGLLPFIRPELGALSVMLMARQAWLRSQDTRTSLIVAIGSDVLFAMLAALPWLLLIKWNTGQMMPATISAKAAFFAEGALPGPVKRMMVWSSFNWMTLTASFLGFVFLPRKLLGYIVLAFFIIFIGAYYAKLPGALNHNYFRYLQILAPFSVFAMLSRARDWPIARLALIASALLVAYTLPRAWDTYDGANAYTRRELEGVASWANENLPPDARVLVHDAGYFAYRTNFELIDLVGLKSTQNIAIHKRITLPTQGALRGLAIHLIALQAKPTYLVALNDNRTFWGNAPFNLRHYQWKVEVLRPAPDLGSYGVFRLTPPAPSPGANSAATRPQ